MFYLNVQKRSSLLVNEKTQGQINNLFENKEQEINSQEKNLVKEQIIKKNRSTTINTDFNSILSSN